MSSQLPDGYRLPETDEDLLAECDATFYQASGPGGQHRNRTMSAVRLCHRPSGLVVIGRRQRSQSRNRADALTRLRARLEELTRPGRPRVPTRPTRQSKERRLREKKERSALKRLRRGEDTR